MRALVSENTLKVCSTSLCNFTWLGQMVSIIIKFNGISVISPERRHIFPKMHKICLEVIINTFKPVKFIALYCCSDKPMISGKFVITVIRPHSFSILSDDRSKASSKTMPPYSAIQSLLLQIRISCPVLKVIR